MARYAVIDAGTVTNIVESEPDFAAAQGWIPAGDGRIGDTWDGESFTTPPSPPPTPPASVTMRQARLALLGAGLLDDVEAAINAMAEPAKTAARIEWDYSSELQRAHPLVTQLGGALGLDNAALDSLFITASGL